MLSANRPDQERVPVMMGRQPVNQGKLYYDISLERRIPAKHGSDAVCDLFRGLRDFLTG